MSISLHVLGQRIVTKRKVLKMSQIQLADKVGISDRTLSKIEHGYDMRLSLLLAIADALEMDVGQLLRLNNDISLTVLNADEKQQICDYLKAICNLLPSQHNIK